MKITSEKSASQNQWHGQIDNAWQMLYGGVTSILPFDALLAHVFARAKQGILVVNDEGKLNTADELNDSIDEHIKKLPGNVQIIRLPVVRNVQGPEEARQIIKRCIMKDVLYVVLAHEVVVMALAKHFSTTKTTTTSNAIPFCGGIHIPMAALKSSDLALKSVVDEKKDVICVVLAHETP